MNNTNMQVLDKLKNLAKHTDLFFGFAVVMVVLLMLIPLPPFFLDILLVFSITLALIILLVTLYASEPLQFSSFPMVLLVSTLFRLALNVSSTRLILLHGSEGIDAAGHVIKAFGNFVVGGNYIVGIVIFIILTIINFMVITKGAGRIAEVAARFTLDAMPGKQLSIDADLNAGHITDVEARKKRTAIEQEADFYGSMDGASKFVRGDAVAGILIVLINIIGGVLIGVLQNDMSILECVQNYTILTVGDGLVAQVPALIISTASGMLVTRVSKDEEVGAQILGQLLNYPRALIVVSGILFLLAIVPGMPFIPFFLLSVTAGVGSYYIQISKSEKKKEDDTKLLLGQEKDTKTIEKEHIDGLLTLDQLEINVGYELINMVDKNRKGELLDRIKEIRKQFAQELGIVIPPIHIRDNLQLKPGEYQVLLKNNRIGGGELRQNFLIAMDPGNIATPIDGIPTTEPVFGLPALWISPEVQESAVLNGYTVVDHPTVVATHITELLKTHAHEMFGRQDLQILLDNFKKSYPKVVEELIPDLLPFGVVLKVLQNLLRELISIRDLLTILESMADNASYTKDPEVLTEFVRQGLSRTISAQFLSPSGDIHVLTLDRSIEEVLAKSIKPSDRGSVLTIEPSIAQKILMQITNKVQEFSVIDTQPIILCASTIRGHLKKLTERFIPNLIVLSYGELDNRVRIKSLGTISLNE